MIVTIVACLWSAQSGKYCVSSNVSRRVYGDKKSIVTPQGLATIPASHARVMLLGNCNVARGRGPGQRKVSSGKRGEFSGDFRGVSWTLFAVYPPAKSRGKTNLLQCISGHKRTNVPIVDRGGLEEACALGIQRRDRFRSTDWTPDQPAVVGTYGLPPPCIPPHSGSRQVFEEVCARKRNMRKQKEARQSCFLKLRETMCEIRRVAEVT